MSFGKAEVQSRVDTIKPWVGRKNRIVFAARFDQEKQPNFFMDIVEEMGGFGVEFVICQGGPLRSNNPAYIERARELESKGKLTIAENLSKNEYYDIVNDSRVLFNCALQDWVSNTVSEADALGCNVVYPAYRSFPETFANDHTRMYVPWSKTDAMEKINKSLLSPSENIGKISDWTNGTIDRMIDIMTGKGEQWLRSGNRYRDHVSEGKY